MTYRIVSRVMAFLAAFGLLGSSALPVNPGAKTKSMQQPGARPSALPLQACSDGWPPWTCPGPAPTPSHK
jgi:hypothetical protein